MLQRARARARARARERYVVICDVGPDPDDVKALLVLAMLDLQGELELAGVIANGGGAHVADRAALARGVLDHAGAAHVPVGVGSAGRATSVGAHEFALNGFARVDRARLEDGRVLLRRLLANARPSSLTLVCISALTDFAELARDEPELLLAKVREVAIQGGVERVDGLPPAAEPVPTGSADWAPDSSSNNLFDLPAAREAYAFCLARGLPMAVISRIAVPLIPMQLARSFAIRTACPLMAYLARSQFEGLEALWGRLCAGGLPARCSKPWFFETFCGVDGAQFEARGFARLGADDPIGEHLNGFVKPYDVVALMAALPATRDLASALRVPVAGRGGGAHRLQLGVEHAIDARFVTRLLRATYHEVVLATVGARAADRGSGTGASALAGVDSSPRARRRLKSWPPPAAAGGWRSWLALPGASAPVAPSSQCSYDRGLRGRVLGATRLPADRPSCDGARLPSARGSAGAPRPPSPPPLAAPAGMAGAVEAPAPAVALRASGERCSADAPPASDVALSPRAEASRWLSGRRARATSRQSTLRRSQLLAPLARVAADRLRSALRAAHSHSGRITLSALVIGCALLCVAVALLVGEAFRASLDSRERGTPGGVVDLRAELQRGDFLRANALLLLLYTLALEMVSAALHPIDTAHDRRVARWVGLVLLGIIAFNQTLHAFILGAILRTAAVRPALINAPMHAMLLAGTASANAGVALAGVTLVRALCRRRLGAHALVRGVRRACTITLVGNVLPFCVATWAFAVRPRVFGLELTPWAPPLVAPAAIVGGALLLALLLATAGAHRRVQALLGRLVSSVGEEAALAALIGFGSAHEREPDQLVDEAVQLLAPVELSGAELERLAYLLAGADGAPTPRHHARFGAGDAAAGGILGVGGKGLDRISGAWPSFERKKPRDAGARRAPLSCGHVRPLPLSRESSALTLAEHARAGSHGQQIDAYVVQSTADPPEQRARALDVWARAFATREGRPPLVYLDVACADPGLEPHELLAHTPCYLALSASLLVLAGPSLTDQLWCVAQLFAWRAMGGTLERVAVVPLGGAARAYDETVAAFDAFHVMYAASDERMVRRRIVRMIELANVATVNEVIHSYAAAVVRPP